MAKTLDDIFNDDDFGLLNSKENKPIVKTERDRLIESFEEINIFFEKNNREPSGNGMSEMRLMMRLKGFRDEESKKRILKPFDKFNLLGEVEEVKLSIDDILEDDEFGILQPVGDSSIFNFVHTPKPDKRAESDFIAQREPIADRDFEIYDKMFQKVHHELKTGKRKLLDFVNIEKNLQVGNFYLLDGMLLYLESANLIHEHISLKSGNRLRIDGRTNTIFENGTKSNMLYRSLGKSIQKSGKLVTHPLFEYPESFITPSAVREPDIESGWVYILKSKSQKPELISISNLYKVGFTMSEISDRIQNASKEPTYLYDEVELVASYKCFNLNAQKFENLIHRFLGGACLNIDIYNEAGHRANPREWFVVPLSVINQTIDLIISGEIVNHRYDSLNQRIVER